MDSVILNNLSLKYQRFAPSGLLDIGISKFEFVAKTQILYPEKMMDISSIDQTKLFSLLL